MKFSVLASMAMAVGGVLLIASPALAEEVDYSTCAVISGSVSGDTCGLTGNPFPSGEGDTYSSSGITLTISGQQPTILSGNTPFDGDIATFAITESGNQSLSLNGLGFSIYVYQTVPGTTGGTLAGSVSGTVYADPSGDYVANFNSGNESLVLDGVNYSLDLQSGGQCAAGDGCAIIPVTSEGKDLTAYITAATPEPTFYTMTGLGFVGLLGIALLRRRRQSQN